MEDKAKPGTTSWIQFGSIPKELVMSVLPAVHKVWLEADKSSVPEMDQHAQLEAESSSGGGDVQLNSSNLSEMDEQAKLEGKSSSGGGDVPVSSSNLSEMDEKAKLEDKSSSGGGDVPVSSSNLSEMDEQAKLEGESSSGGGEYVPVSSSNLSEMDEQAKLEADSSSGGGDVPVSSSNLSEMDEQAKLEGDSSSGGGEYVPVSTSNLLEMDEQANLEGESSSGGGDVPVSSSNLSEIDEQAQLEGESSSGGGEYVPVSSSNLSQMDEQAKLESESSSRGEYVPVSTSNLSEMIEQAKLEGEISSGGGGDLSLSSSNLSEIDEQAQLEGESSSGGGEYVPVSSSNLSEMDEQAKLEADSSSGGGDVLVSSSNLSEMDEQSKLEADSSSGGGDVPVSSSNLSQARLEADSSRGGGDVPANSSNLSESVDSCPPNIMSGLAQACKDLGNCELIHEDDFDLSAVMHIVKALCDRISELRNEINQKAYPDLMSANYFVGEAIIDGAATADRKVDVQCFIDLMDHILSCEATWHATANLPQTLGSRFDIGSHETFSSVALVDSFWGVVKITREAVTSVFSSSHSNNEDDRNLYYRSSETSVEKESLSMLQEALKTISRHLWAASKQRRYVRVVEPLQTNPTLEEEFCKAILCRLRFRKYFYSVLSCMRWPQVEGLDLAKKHIASSLIELDSMLRSEKFLRSSSSDRVSKDTVKSITTASGCLPDGSSSAVNSARVATAAINSRFAALTRPHVVRLLHWREAVNYFKKILDDLKAICLNTLHPVLGDALRFAIDFHKLQPCRVATSHLELLLVQDRKLYGREPIFAVICKASSLPERAKYHDIQKNKTVERLGALLISYIRTLCKCIPKQRRILGKSMWQWEELHAELLAAFTDEYGDLTETDELLAAFTDEYGDLTDTDELQRKFNVKICNGILKWLVKQRLWISLRFLLLGFDLELYSPGEYCMVYWYIHITMLRLSEVIHAGRLDIWTKEKRKAKKNLELSNDQEDENDDLELQLQPDQLLLCAKAYLAQGIFMILNRFSKKHSVSLHEGPFNYEEERFHQLFPPGLSCAYSLFILWYTDVPGVCCPYSLFKHCCTCNASVSISEIEECFQSVENSCRLIMEEKDVDQDTLGEAKQLNKVVRRNLIALDILHKYSTHDSPLKFSLDFRYHPYFAVASLKR